MRSHHSVQCIHCPLKTRNSVLQPAGLLSPVHTSINSTCSSPLNALPVYHNRGTVPKLDCLHVCKRSPFPSATPRNTTLSGGSRKHETAIKTPYYIKENTKRTILNHLLRHHRPPESEREGGGRLSVIDR